jgi:hypothetical protein
MPTKSQVEAKQHQAAVRRAASGTEFEDREKRLNKLRQTSGMKEPPRFFDENRRSDERPLPPNAFRGGD